MRAAQREALGLRHIRCIDLYARCLEQVGPDGCAIVTDVQDSFTGEDELDLSEEERQAAAFLTQKLLAVE